MGVIQEVKNKYDRLNRPRGFSCVPVLIHINGVNNSVAEAFFLRLFLILGLS